jgi:hypothetical protein
MPDLMPDKRIGDLRQRALTTIAELNASHGTIAETLRPYRIRHVENMLQALKARAEDTGSPDDERDAARRAIAEIEALFREAVRDAS